MKQRRITDDLDALLGVLPPRVAQAVSEANNSDNLLEVILDLGRIPTARFTNDEELVLSEVEVTPEDINYVVERVGDFDADNRAGLERTLHRISAIRNRRGHIVGLTCRVGRAVYGTLDIIQDLIESGKSVLLLGRPGVGKTTLLREAARILAESQRAVVVDTSNEIGGDGDVPHPAVGRARRMQVATPSLQHEVMIEAVENHNPQVIIIDEIGRELEAAAARTIAERGVQLIGTAHGNTLENLLINPTLSDLVGGIESVTLSDEEARRRGTQKTVLERRSPPTFDVLIEIQTRDRLAVHADVAASVDALLRGYPLEPELRYRDEHGQIMIEKAKGSPLASRPGSQGFRRRDNGAVEHGRSGGAKSERFERATRAEYAVDDDLVQPATGKLRSIRIYPYGVARNRLAQAAKRLRVPAVIVSEIGEADALVTLRTYYRKRQRTVMDAEQRGMPIYVLRSNTVNQMSQFLSDLFNLRVVQDEEGEADSQMQNTQSAIDAVLNGEDWIELPPASSYIRRLQHQMARQANLVSHSYGKEPYRRVRIFRQ
jgi:stage III sporulation protein SpoIIIAA